MGSKILTFPVPAMGTQELREDLTNGNTHTCRAFRMAEPKAPSREEGVYSMSVVLREVERRAQRMSGEAACFAASS